MEFLTKNKLLTAVLAVLSVAGIGAYIFQLAGGLAVTGMSNGVSWGLYITMFMFFVEMCIRDSHNRHAERKPL